MADKIICNKSDLVNIADAIRTKLDVIDTYYVPDLGSTVSNELTKKLPTLSNPISASDLLSGKELIDQDGNVVTGNIPTKTSSDLTSEQLLELQDAEITLMIGNDNGVITAYAMNYKPTKDYEMQVLITEVSST